MEKPKWFIALVDYSAIYFCMFPLLAYGMQLHLCLVICCPWDKVDVTVLNPPTTRELSLISHISSFDFLFTHLAIQG